MGIDLVQPEVVVEGQFTIHQGHLEALLADSEVVGTCARRLLDGTTQLPGEELARLLHDLYEGVGRMAEAMVATESLAVEGSKIVIDLRSSTLEEGFVAAPRQGRRQKPRSQWFPRRLPATS